MSIAVVAEKPAVARDLARVLGAEKRGEGFLHGNGYVVTWAIGHLVALAEPGEMRPEWKRWRREQLPILPREWPLVVSEGTRAQFGVVRKILTSPNVTAVVCATDAGREGELIFRYIYEAAGSDKPFQRLWVSSLTPDAIRRGFASLRAGRDLDPLADAARGRSRADWLVGMNLSRACSLAFDEDLSVGRVQTPTLAMVVERELAIRAFVPEDYLEVEATFAPPEGQPGGSYRGTWYRPDPDGRRLPADLARAKRLPPEGAPGRVGASERSERAERTERSERPDERRRAGRAAGRARNGIGRRHCGPGPRRTGGGRVGGRRDETPGTPPPLRPDRAPAPRQPALRLERPEDPRPGAGALRALEAPLLPADRQPPSLTRRGGDAPRGRRRHPRPLRGAPGAGDGRARARPPLRRRRQGHGPPRHPPDDDPRRGPRPPGRREGPLRPRLPPPPRGLARRSRMGGDDRRDRGDLVAGGRHRPFLPGAGRLDVLPARRLSAPPGAVASARRPRPAGRDGRPLRQHRNGDRAGGLEGPRPRSAGPPAEGRPSSRRRRRPRSRRLRRCRRRSRCRRSRRYRRCRRSRGRGRPVRSAWSGGGRPRLAGAPRRPRGRPAAPRDGGRGAVQADPSAAALHGGDPPHRDGDGRPRARRQGALGGDARHRSRHAGDPCRDDRDAPPPRLRRAAGQGPRGDREGHPPDRGRPPAGEEPRDDRPLGGGAQEDRAAREGPRDLPPGDRGLRPGGRPRDLHRSRASRHPDLRHSTLQRRRHVGRSPRASGGRVAPRRPARRRRRGGWAAGRRRQRGGWRGVEGSRIRAERVAPVRRGRPVPREHGCGKPRRDRTRRGSRLGRTRCGSEFGRIRRGSPLGTSRNAAPRPPRASRRPPPRHLPPPLLPALPGGRLPRRRRGPGRAPGDADRRRQVALLPAPGPRPRRHDARRLAAHRAHGGPGRASSRRSGLRAERIHSGRDRAASRAGLRATTSTGELDFLFIAPERLARARLPRDARPAHAGRSSRSTRPTASPSGATTSGPTTGMLGERLPALRPAPVIALTATATPRVQDDIVAQLGLAGAAPLHPRLPPHQHRGRGRRVPPPTRRAGGRPRSSPTRRAGRPSSTRRRARRPRRSARELGARLAARPPTTRA